MSNRSYLIIDDSLTARMKLKGLLEDAGVTVLLESNAHDGTARAIESPPDVAILDVVLPDQDGVSVCQTWQEHPDLRLVPVLLVSGERAGQDDRLAGLRSGAVGYLVKPFDDREVLATVENLYKLRQVAKEQALLNEELSRRNNELGAFAHIVSHDLKAPLRAIGSLADCISQDCGDRLDDEALRNLLLLKGRAARMHELIGGILRYSASGEVRGDVRMLDSEAIVRATIEALAPPEHIEVGIEGRLPSVRYDRIQLEQVLQNLIGNAIRYMDKERGRIRVSCAETPRAWRFCVEDNGPGIPDRHVEQIFRIFQTLAPRDEREATGVGLAIVRRIVEQNGGAVWVESRAGDGSHFVFTIPRGSAPGAGEASSQ